MGNSGSIPDRVASSLLHRGDAIWIPIPSGSSNTYYGPFESRIAQWKDVINAKDIDPGGDPGKLLGVMVVFQTLVQISACTFLELHHAIQSAVKSH